MTLTQWINPEAPEPSAARVSDSRSASAQHAGAALRIALLDNTKDNAALLLQLIGERVKEEFGANLSLHRKGNATLGADDALLETLARDHDCVLTAMAD